MIYHTCIECQRGFVAESRKEAEEAYNRQVEKGGTAAAAFQDAIDTGEVAYARFCPYCGSSTIETA